MKGPEHSVVFYDGHCPMCNALILKLLKWDQKESLRYAPLESSFAQSLLGSRYQDLISKDTLVFYHQGETSIQSEAVLSIFEVIDAMYWLRLLSVLVPGKIKDWIYSKIASNRKKLKIKCPLIPQTKQHLFLD